MFSTIYLHIGQTKTGSSYIQSSLAMAKDRLAAQGISYPIEDHVAEAASAGEITSGNFWPRPGQLELVVNRGVASRLPALLISSEAMFDLMSPENSTFIQQLRALAPDARWKVMCFVRDPIDHAVSVYHQQVKRGGFTGNLAESLKSYDVPARTISALSQLRRVGAETTIINYSVHKGALLECMEKWLGVPAGSLPTPVVPQINRSLTNTELMLQRAFNRHFGAEARLFVSDPLCHMLPDLRSEIPPLARTDLDAFLRRMKAVMGSEAYLGLVPEGERPRVGDPDVQARRFPPDGADLQYSMTAGQIDAIADAVSAELKKVEALRRQLEQARAQLHKLREPQ